MQIDYPPSSSTPNYVIPSNPLLSGSVIPTSAINSDGTANMTDLAWWGVVQNTLYYPGFTQDQKINWLYPALTDLITLAAPSTGTGSYIVPNSVDIGNYLLKSHSDNNVIASLTCLFYNP